MHCNPLLFVLVRPADLCAGILCENNCLLFPEPYFPRPDVLLPSFVVALFVFLVLVIFALLLILFHVPCFFCIRRSAALTIFLVLALVLVLVLVLFLFFWRVSSCLSFFCLFVLSMQRRSRVQLPIMQRGYQDPPRRPARSHPSQALVPPPQALVSNLPAAAFFVRGVFFVDPFRTAPMFLGTSCLEFMGDTLLPWKQRV